MMALSVVSCSDDGDDEEGSIDMVIANAMDLSGTADTAEAVYVSAASGGGKAIIPGMMPFVTLNPKDVYVTGSFDSTDTGLENAVHVTLNEGTFTAVYQVQSDNDGDCTEGTSGKVSCSDDGYETDITGEITSQFTLEDGKTYVVYFCSLAADDDARDDYLKVYEKGDSWIFADMTVVEADSVTCDESNGGSCTGIDVD